MVEPFVIVISGDIPLEVLGAEERAESRLYLDGNIPASIYALNSYFSSDGDIDRVRKDIENHFFNFISRNGIYLKQFLEQNGFNVELIQVFSIEKERLKEFLIKGPCAVIISTTFLPFRKQIDEMATYIKQYNKDIPVIVGGIHIWKSYKSKILIERKIIDRSLSGEISEHSYFLSDKDRSSIDIWVISESGERTLLKILKCILEGKKYDTLPNIAYLVDGKWRFNEIISEPCIDLTIDWSNVKSPHMSYIPVQTGRGCFFGCAFCDFRGLVSFASYSIENILKEIETIPADIDGKRRVYFIDDNLFPTRDRAIELCKAIIEADLNIRWRGMMRVDIVDGQVAELMAKSGCIEVLLGIESGDESILKRMKKPITKQSILSAVKSLSEAGINTKSTFIIGFPGETCSTVENTLNLLNEYPTSYNAAHRYLFFQFALLPLSEVFSEESRRVYGLKGYGYKWEHTTMNSEGALRIISYIHTQIKPELSPTYVQEVPEFPGLDNSDIKKIYYLRNRLVQEKKKNSISRELEELWEKLRAVFIRRR